LRQPCRTARQEAAAAKEASAKLARAEENMARLERQLAELRASQAELEQSAEQWSSQKQALGGADGLAGRQDQGEPGAQGRAPPRPRLNARCAEQPSCPVLNSRSFHVEPCKQGPENRAKVLPTGLLCCVWLVKSFAPLCDGAWLQHALCLAPCWVLGCNMPCAPNTVLPVLGAWLQLLEERRLTLAMKLGKLEESMEELEDLRMRCAGLEGELAQMSNRAADSWRRRRGQKPPRGESARSRGAPRRCSAGLGRGAVRGRSDEGHGGYGGGRWGRERGGGGGSMVTGKMEEEVRSFVSRTAELKRVVSEQKSELDSIRARPGTAGAAPMGGAFGGRMGNGRLGGGIMSARATGADKAAEELRRRTVALEGELLKKVELLAAAERRSRTWSRKRGSLAASCRSAQSRVCTTWLQTRDACRPNNPSSFARNSTF